jgi:hypothetical protein
MSSRAIGYSIAAGVLFVTLTVCSFTGIPFVGDNQAKIVITAPTTIASGQLAVLSVEGSDANAFAWKVVPETANFMVIDDGRRAVFSGTNGTYLFIVSAAKGDTVAVETHNIIIGDGIAPTPGPADLSAKVVSWAKLVQPASRDEAIKLAQSFNSVSATVAAGVITTPTDIVNVTKTSNRQALGTSIAKWTPFLEALNVELSAQAKAGTLTDAASHAKAWRQIAIGLEKYANSL